MENADKAIHLNAAWNLICDAINHMEAVSKINGSIGVGVITDCQPLIDARQYVLTQLGKELRQCDSDDLRVARIKITGS